MAATSGATNAPRSTFPVGTGRRRSADGRQRRHTERCTAARCRRACRCGARPAAPLFALTGDDGAPDATDHATFEHLYRAISPRLQRFVRRAEPAEADDISADVWLAVTRYLPRFRGDADGFEALVFTIARRRITDHRRRRARRRTDARRQRVARRPRRRRRARQSRRSTSCAPGPRSRSSCGRCSPAQVEVVVLRVVHGLPVERVATMLGRSPGNVRILQHRALKRLRAS